MTPAAWACVVCKGAIKTRLRLRNRMLLSLCRQLPCLRRYDAYIGGLVISSAAGERRADEESDSHDEDEAAPVIDNADPGDPRDRAPADALFGSFRKGGLYAVPK